MRLSQNKTTPQYWLISSNSLQVIPTTRSGGWKVGSDTFVVIVVVVVMMCDPNLISIHPPSRSLCGKAVSYSCRCVRSTLGVVVFGYIFGTWSVFSHQVAIAWWSKTNHCCCSLPLFLPPRWRQQEYPPTRSVGRSHDQCSYSAVRATQLLCEALQSQCRRSWRGEGFVVLRCCCCLLAVIFVLQGVAELPAAVDCFMGLMFCENCVQCCWRRSDQNSHVSFRDLFV